MLCDEVCRSARVRAAIAGAAGVFMSALAWADADATMMEVAGASDRDVYAMDYGETEDDILDARLAAGEFDVGNDVGRGELALDASAGVYASTSSACRLSQAFGNRRDKGLKINGVYWLQVVQQRANDPRAALSSGKPVRVRVDVTSPRNGVPLPAEAQIMLRRDNGSFCKRYTLRSKARYAPQQVDPETLSGSYTVDIDGRDVKPGSFYEIVVDANYPSTDHVAKRLRRNGRLPVRAPISGQIVILPIEFKTSRSQLPAPSELVRLIGRTTPLSSVRVTTAASVAPSMLNSSRYTQVGQEYRFDVSDMQSLLMKMDDHCLELQADDPGQDEDGFIPLHCFAVYPPNITFYDSGRQVRITGAAYTGGLTALVPSFSETDIYQSVTPYEGQWLSPEASTLLHEFGHLMGLRHANCGGVKSNDQRLYRDGGLGQGGGFDPGREFYFAGPKLSLLHDVMSYCHPRWISDRGYRAMMEFKHNSQLFNATDKQWVRLSWQGEEWSARIISASIARPESLIPSKHGVDARYISDMLIDVPMLTYESDIPESKHGPFFVELDPQLLTELKAGRIHRVQLLKNSAQMGRR